MATISKSPLSAFLDRKQVVLDKLVPCAVNTLIGTVGSIAGGLHGLVLVLDKARAGEEVGPTDVLGVMFDDLPNRVLFWAPMVGLMVASSILSAILPLLTLLMLPAMLALFTVMPLALIAVAREKTPWLAAWKSAFTAIRSDLGGTGLFMLVTGILGGVGSIALGVGALITLPISLLAQLDGYDEAGGIATA
jgi:hypothetical protein